MAGVFDKINGALSGKAPAPSAPATKTGNADFSDLRRGMGTPGTTSGLDAAMQQHADKLHPVKVRPDMGEIQG
jgi:hypothetical protein